MPLRRTQRLDAETARAPVHAVVRQVQHPAAEVGNALGLAEQVTLAQRLLTLRRDLRGHPFARADVMLEDDEMAEALRVDHGREHQLVPEWLAGLAVGAQDHLAGRGTPPGPLQLRQT